MVVFRLGLTFILDTYPSTLETIVYFVSFFNDKELIGIVQFPVVKMKTK